MPPSDLFSALTAPRVNVKLSPKGFPKAITISPTWRLDESPREAVGRSLPSILNTAMSVWGSAPTTLPVKVRSAN
jgi:hypothetical protein